MVDWGIELTPRAEKALKGLDPSVQRRVIGKLREIRGAHDPRDFLKPMRGELARMFRLRVGDYRVIVDVQDARWVILAVDIGHRSTIYDR